MAIWAYGQGGLRNGYPEVEEQRCWNHKIFNVVDKLPKREQTAAKSLLYQIPFTPTQWDRRRNFYAGVTCADICPQPSASSGAGDA